MCLFDEDGSEDQHRLTERSLGIWHGAVPGVAVGTRYGYRVAGPWAPEQGLRFNPHKLLLDPYARAISGELVHDPAIVRLRPGRPRRAATRSTPRASCPRSVVVDDDFDWQGDTPLRRRWRDTVIYELHVKGMTQLHDRVPERAARHLRRARHARRSPTTCATSGSPRSSCCRSTSSAPSPRWPRAAW